MATSIIHTLYSELTTSQDKGKRTVLKVLQEQEDQDRSILKILDDENKGYISMKHFIEELNRLGLDCRRINIKEELNEWIPSKDGKIDYETFLNLMRFDKFRDTLARRWYGSILHKAFSGKLAIPDWINFCSIVSCLFDSIKENIHDGELASYIPLLAKEDPNMFGISICTVDGQVFEYGDASYEFTMQSCSSPLIYLLALQEHGDKVHEYIGREPSGQAFNSFTLNPDKPHNPLINSGAIVCCSMVGQSLSAPDRFDKVRSDYASLAGNGKVGFSQATFLSEKDTADRNFALAYYLMSAGCTPENTDIKSTLDFYFQTCSLEVDCRSLATIASTLANGGVCPITQKKCADAKYVKEVLQVMFSCGMSDYSGTWSCTVGIPAKSGISGGIMLIVPNVMGIAIYSPNVDEKGNSTRGVEFSKKLAEVFSLSIFDQMMRTGDKINIRERKMSIPNSIQNMLQQHREMIDPKKRSLSSKDLYSSKRVKVSES